MTTSASKLSAEGADLHLRHNFVVDKGQQPLRIDKFLCLRLPQVSRHKIQQSIQHELIQVNGVSPKASYKVRPADQICLYLPTPPTRKDILPEAMPIRVLYEDEDLLVVLKPAGLVVHPAHGNWEGTLLNGLLHYLLPQPEAYPYLVHRLDKNTSGLLVVAKQEVAMCGLAQQFFAHTVERSYWALVWGHPDPPSGTIDMPLQRSPKDRRIVCVSSSPEQGKRAVTHYKLLQAYKYVSLLECRLETGRTHQIRAHLKQIGHPLFNDQTYGGDVPRKGLLTSSYKQFLHNCWKLLPYQALHAKELGFVHPRSGKEMHFESEAPPALQAVIDKWQRYSEGSAPPRQATEE